MRSPLATISPGAAGPGPDGKEHVGMDARDGLLPQYRRAWRIAHEHFSAPFDPESGKALFDLEP